MKIMKRALPVLIALPLALGLSACGGHHSKDAEQARAQASAVAGSTQTKQDETAFKSRLQGCVKQEGLSLLGKNGLKAGETCLLGAEPSAAGKTCMNAAIKADGYSFGKLEQAGVTCASRA